MLLSLDESIQKLKTEIISQDWSLPPKKIEPLQAAITRLKDHFDTRKNALAILSMADSILLYAQKRQGQVTPEFIDFLKEAMAHVVNMHEEDNFTSDQDAELCKRVYGKFVRLREKATMTNGTPASSAEQETKSSIELESWPEPVFLNEQASGLAQARTEIDPATMTQEQPSGKAATTGPLAFQQGDMTCPVTIGSLILGIVEADIALIKPLSPKMRKAYVKNGQVPLKDLGNWLGRLSHQMQGPLALLKNSRLKKLKLPLLSPKDEDLADIVDQAATMLLVVSKGHRHGVILCRLVQKATPLLSLTRKKRGDIFGPARLGEGQVLPMLNLAQLLSREGLSTSQDKNAAERRQPDHVNPQEGKIMSNMRKNTRVPFQVAISLDFPDRSHADYETADLSLKGVFVLGLTGHKIGENCLATLSLVGSTSHLNLQIKGTVVRVKEDGLALHFYEMDLDSFFHLKNILYYNSENPDTLAEEIAAQIENFHDND